jgi:hypothetical protein
MLLICAIAASADAAQYLLMLRFLPLLILPLPPPPHQTGEAADL